MYSACVISNIEAHIILVLFIKCRTRQRGYEVLFLNTLVEVLDLTSDFLTSNWRKPFFVLPEMCHKL